MAKYLRECGLSVASILMLVLTSVAAVGSQLQVGGVHALLCTTGCSCFGAVDKKVACAADGCGSSCGVCPASTYCS